MLVLDTRLYSFITIALPLGRSQVQTLHHRTGHSLQRSTNHVQKPR